MLRVARFLHAYFRRRAGSVRQEEIRVEVAGAELPASYLRPRGDAPVPAWILLHGITVPGRHHPLLRRFAQSLAATGAAVLIPEVPAWQRLRIDLAAGDATIAAAIEHLARRGDVAGAPNLAGFSFGATQALTSSTLPGVLGRLGAVFAFGGYADPRATLRFMMTGEHEWEGVTRRLEPDPYGRWIAVANYLGDVPGLAHMTELADAAATIAAESGRMGIFAGESVYDPMKARLRAALPPAQRELWDLIAPPSGVDPPREPGLELAGHLADAAVRREPAFDPRPALARIAGRIVLAHGYDDRLIPYTETLRLRRHMPPDADATVAITRLFSHSTEADRLRLREYPAEIARYLTLLSLVITAGDRAGLSRRPGSR